MPTQFVDTLSPFILVLAASLWPLLFLFSRQKRKPLPVGPSVDDFHAAIIQQFRAKYGDDVVVETVDGETNVYVGEMARRRKRAA